MTAEEEDLESRPFNKCKKKQLSSQLLLQLGESEKATLARPREKYINNTAKHTKNSLCLTHTYTNTGGQRQHMQDSD